MNRKNSVLIVDDRKENITALKSILDELYTIYISLSGNIALEVMKKNPIDIVLLDINMPVMDGIEVLSIMKQTPELKNIPVIFITSETDEFNESKGLTLGAVDYIKKPYNPNIVCIKVKNQLENKMYRDELEELVDIRTKELQVSREAIIMGMSLLAEGRDQSTGDHIKRMQRVTKLLAEQISKEHPDLLTREECDKIVLMAPLHDIGKVYVADSILLKPGKLTDEEFEKMKAHTYMGAEVLKKTESILSEYNNILHTAVEIAEYHHEKYNGRGYPHGIQGDKIPMSAAICALADVYDALTSDRPYKKAFTHEEAKGIIFEGDGRVEAQHFNPLVLEAFLAVEAEIKSLTLASKEQDLVPER